MNGYKIMRIKKGLTIKEAAERSGVSETSIGKIERGETSPMVKTLEKMAEAYGCEIADFFTQA